MDIFLIILGSLLMILGIFGCFLPVLPGPPLSYLALIAIHFTEKVEFSVSFLIWWGIVTVLISVLDYFIPIWGAKTFGGSKAGVRGSIAGLILGLFFPPFGLILGPFVGAVVGEMIAGNKQNALRSGFGSFIGFLAGSFAKLIVCLIMLFFFIKALI
ncbi:MAG: DUF456 domain-containing protein [Mariniphaga sp.]